MEIESELGRGSVFTAFLNLEILDVPSHFGHFVSKLAWFLNYTMTSCRKANEASLQTM